MKRLSRLLWPPLATADFETGLKAYKRGEYAAAHREWLPLADQGDAQAQFNLGLMYANGRGVPQDAAQALTWFRKAAAQGHATGPSQSRTHVRQWPGRAPG